MSGCKPLLGVSLGSGITGTPTTGTNTDAGTGVLTGQVVLLSDQTFVSAALFTKTATVSADGVTGTAVTAAWDGVDTFELDGVAQEATNWINVKPDDIQGDALLTYQPVSTSSVSNANLAVISSTLLDGLFTSVTAQRSPSFAQVVLFFRNVGTGSAISGLHVTMASAQVAAYSTSAGFVLDDGTAVTDASGLVLFGNVETTLANDSTQTVTVSRPATATSAAVSGGTFAIKVGENAATIATVSVSL